VTNPDDASPRPSAVRVPATPGKLTLAIAAGWVLPGLGHVLLGRYRRGILFGALILGSFAMGMAHEGRLALRDDRQPFLSLLQVVANAGVGPLDFWARSHVYGEVAYSLPRDTADPRHDARLRILRERTTSVLSIYGTAYLWTAGLMNLLLLFDVFDVGSGRKN
jgi:hypothetical protein